MKKRTLKHCRLCDRRWIDFADDISGRCANCRKWSVTVRRVDPVIKFSPTTGALGDRRRWVVMEEMPGDPTRVYHVGDLDGLPGDYRLNLHGRDGQKWINDYKQAALEQLGIVVTR